MALKRSNFSGRRLLRGIVRNRYLIDSDSFFIKTDVSEGLKHYYSDFDTENVKFKASERFSINPQEDIQET